MSADISLFELVNLSIGTPEIGAVNLNALHTLLHAIVEHLQIQRVTTVWREPNRTEPCARELLSHAPPLDVWQVLQLRGNVQANQDGVSQCMTLLQELMKQMHELKQEKDNLRKEVETLEHQLNQLAARVVAVEQCFRQVEDVESTMRDLKGQMALYPQPEELSHCVTWEVMQATLVSERQMTKKEMKDSFITTRPPATPSTDSISQNPRGSSKGALHLLDNSNSPSDPMLHAEVSLPGQGPSDGAKLGNHSLSWVISGAQHYPETVKALTNLGYLQVKHESLVSRVESLEECKSDQSEVQQLLEKFSLLGKKNMPEKVMEQVNYLNTLVDNVMADRQKTLELMSSVQCAILQLQAECEKHQSAFHQLMDDHNKKQSQIDQLFKIMEELNKKKADKEVVEMEMDVKADKLALDTKVSHMQFDTMTEHLNGLCQELLGKITGQEQDWHKVLEKICREMDSKLDRIELDSVRKQLEDHRKKILRQLQAHPAPEYDDAAGFRKQLVARFRCISCDRAIDMHTPGPHILSVPLAPGLPSHKSNRPYTIYELEHVRQHFRSDHTSENADDGYRAMSRSCGGSHTVAYANRRCSQLRHFTHLNQSEGDELATPCSGLQIQPEEVDILGLDGQIYKGRVSTRTLKALDPRLPTVSPKEGNCKGKSRMSVCQSQKCIDTKESAKTQHTLSGFSTSGKEPIPMACLSHANSLQSPPDLGSGLLQGQELHSNF